MPPNTDDTATLGADPHNLSVGAAASLEEDFQLIDDPPEHEGERSESESYRGLSQPLGIHLNYALGLSNEVGPPHCRHPCSPSRLSSASLFLYFGFRFNVTDPHPHRRFSGWPSLGVT